MSRNSSTTDPRSLMGLHLAHRPRGVRSFAVLISVALHIGAVLLFVVNLAHKPQPRPPAEREPILVRLPRAAAPPAAAAPAKAPEKQPPKVRPREQIAQPVPAVTPPEPEEAPEPETPEGEPTAEESAVAPPAVASSDQGKAGGVVGGIGDGPLELKEVARAPTLIERVTPDYPRQARADHIQGIVLLRAVIGRDGRVERDQIRVLRSVRALDEAAISALGAWRFFPAIDHRGQTVRVVVEIPFEFTLS